jgi:glycosyltransferase involved in cell wall biosynthesis
MTPSIFHQAIFLRGNRSDQQYFVDEVEPLLNHPGVEFIGEIGEEEKNDFLGNALALLVPIDWPEPLGLVMIESFATGTPVIAFANGSVPEIIEHGRTGFIAENLEEACCAVGKISSISLQRCRENLKHALESDGWPVNTSPFMKNFWPTAKRRAVMIFDLFGRLPDGVRVPCWI